MVLRVLAGVVAVCATTCLIDEVFSTFEVFLVASHLIQFAEGHLDDGVTARAVNLSLVRTESLANKVGVLDGYVEEGLLACSAIVGYGTLDEMAGVIELVRVDLLPLVGAPPTAQARTFISNTGCQVPIGLLSLGDNVDDGVEIMIQFGVIMDGE